MADVTNQPGVVHAIVTDESWLSDFLPISCYGSVEERKLSYRKKIDKTDNSERKAAYERIIDKLDAGPSREEAEKRIISALASIGIEVDDIGQPIYELAIQLRDR